MTVVCCNYFWRVGQARAFAALRIAAQPPAQRQVKRSRRQVLDRAELETMHRITPSATSASELPCEWPDSSGLRGREYSWGEKHNPLIYGGASPLKQA